MSVLAAGVSAARYQGGGRMYLAFIAFFVLAIVTTPIFVLLLEIAIRLGIIARRLGTRRYRSPGAHQANEWNEIYGGLPRHG